jgi:predicted CXXCH cytochrome family protein
MRRRTEAVTLLLTLLLMVSAALGQITGDVIGQHALGPGSSNPVKGTLPGSCQYCHAPHSGLNIALWNQKLSSQTYTPYSSSTYSETGNTTVPAGTDTSLCLSCHDGTVATGTSVVYGQLASGSLLSQDTIATLQSSHPVSLVLPLNDAADLVSTVVSGTSADPSVTLPAGNVECTSCHNPHVEAKDPVAKNFLVRESSQGTLCLACHDPNRVYKTVTSPLSGWGESIHATSTASVQNLPYATLQLNACLNCHTDHNATGAEWVQRGSGDQVCLNCHSPANTPATPAPGRGTPLTPRLAGPISTVPRLNVASEYAKIGHPSLSAPKPSDAKPARDRTQPQAITPATPTQSGCIDCHDPHAVQAINAFTGAPASRVTQKGVSGLSEKDGTSIVKPASAQYETCLRCHGPSAPKTASAKFGYQPLRTGGGGEPLNLLQQFGAQVRSSHPVALGARSMLPQPSLRTNMLNLNGTTQGRSMGERIFCTDCHNSDDNREFGGSGPSGPHGSKWTHILERRYEFTEALVPGGPVNTLNPTPDLSSNGPYALCAKCHDLNNVVHNASFKQHAAHINSGFSCSACHTAHGTQGNSTNSSGERLVNFDLNVVAASSNTPVSYNRGAGTCTLTCHEMQHFPNGAVKRVVSGLGKR